MNLAALRLTFLVVCFFALAVVSNAQSGAGAPPIYEVKFVRGSFVHKGAVSIPGPCSTVGGAECSEGHSTDLFIKARRGERIRIMITSDTGGAVFSIFAPGLNLIRNGSSTTSWTGTLWHNGDYPLNVYTDKGSTNYTLTVTRLNSN